MWIYIDPLRKPLIGTYLINNLEQRETLYGEYNANGLRALYQAFLDTHNNDVMHSVIQAIICVCSK